MYYDIFVYVHIYIYMFRIIVFQYEERLTGAVKVYYDVFFICVLSWIKKYQYGKSYCIPESKTQFPLKSNLDRFT